MKLLTTLFLFASLLSPALAQCPTLLWSDEFDGTALDPTKWAPQIGDGCALGQDLCGWGNAEMQYYRAENAVVSNGTLQIVAKQEEFGGRSHTSARIRSLGLAEFDLTQPHLRFESRLKVPAGKGMWPAFWMLPSFLEVSQWPLGGEIDIMEYIGREPNNAHGYLHYGNAWNDRTVKGGPIRTPGPADDFHVYAIEKTPNQIDFFLDGHLFQTITANDVEPVFNWPFESTFHFILNLAVGGHWPEYPDETTVFPSTLQVDYVRVYDFAEATFGQITGTRLVHVNQTDEVYCIEGEAYDTITWTVPEGATFVEGSSNCITVNYGMASGYVQAVAQSACDTQMFSVPVEVQPFYKKEFSFVAPGTDDRASLITSTGAYNVTNGVVEYSRNIAEVYDYIELETTIITDPELYVSELQKFYMDIKSPTAAPCTRILIQLEDSSVTTPDNFPLGRHSRYIAFMEDVTDWQRLEFDFYDRPQLGVGQVDRILILLDSFVERADQYSFRNLDSAATGCTVDCEALTTNQCRKRAKSEAGACNDGVNNDGVGYDGDGTIDCDDSDCWDDPACLALGASPPPSSTVPVPPASPSAVPNPSPTATDTGETPSPTESPLSESTAPSLEFGSGESQAVTFEATSGAPPASFLVGMLSLLLLFIS